MPKRTLTWIFFSIALIWMAGALFSFFKSAPGGEDGIMWGALFGVIPLIFERILWHYIVVILILLASYALGSKFGSIIKLEFTSVLEKTIIRLASGIAIISMGTMLLGFLHLLYVPILWLYLLPDNYLEKISMG